MFSTEWIVTCDKDISGRLSVDQPLSKYTTWRVGGLADLLLIPTCIDDLATVLSKLPVDIPVTVLGLGSNVLIQEGGIRGLTIVMQGSGLTHIECHSDCFVTAQAAVPCGKLARICARNELSSAEFLAGVPGTMGGALTMNAGCYGGETWDLVHSVQMLTRQGELVWRDRSEFEVSYRKVVKPTPDEIFVATKLLLKPGVKADSLAMIKAMLDKRNKAQPTNLPNCGSVFKNPEGYHAAALIESMGLKGHRSGTAQISEKHANFIVNLGGATANDILSLIELMRLKVKEALGIDLVTEVRVLGEVL
jgi:UDP-N-acetylmuramate dehydrogenase